MAKKNSKPDKPNQAKGPVSGEPAKQWWEYSADAPAKTSGEDRFQRWPFAQRIARVIATRKDPESLVIGINGAWGEGKTTVFYFIEEELKEHPNVVTFRFNPWRFPDESKLVRDFFQTLAAALEKSIVTGRKKAGDYISKYVSIPGALAGAVGLGGLGDAAKAVGDLLSSVELEKLKERVEAILKEANKRVVVLMDDIDRLDKAEIQTVFRLVKLVADFKNTAYVLAFDSDMVASALQERYSSHDKEAGRSFLEKIIQVPLDLPHIPKTSLRKYCLEIIQHAVEDAGIELTDNDAERFVVAFDAGLLIRLNTPRMAKRYGNILSFSLPILKGEVNAIDLILIEGIRVFYPKLYETVRDHAEIFLGSRVSGLSDRTDRQAVNQQIQAIVDASLDTMSASEKKAAIGLIERLFPRMEGVYGGMTYAGGYEEHWASQRLIASGTYFQRYFSYAIPEGQIGDQELTAFAEQLSMKDSGAVAAELKDLIEPENADFIIGKLRLMTDYLDVRAATTLALAIASDGSIFPNPRQMFSFGGPYSPAAMLVSDVVGRVALLENAGKAADLARKAIEIAEPLDFATEIFSWLRIEKADGDDGEEERDRRGRLVRKSLPEAERQSLGVVLARRIKSELSASSGEDNRRLTRLLGVWAAYTTVDETTAFVAQRIQADESFVIRFLDGFRPTAWGMTTGLSSKKGFERGEYDYLIKIADPEMIRRALEKRFGAYTPTEHLPRYAETDTDRLVAEQFLWLHDHVGSQKQAEAQETQEPADDSTDAGEAENEDADEDTTA